MSVSHSFRGEASWRSPWRPYTDNRKHTGHLHSSPYPINTYKQAHWQGWHVCLGKDVVNVKSAYTATPFLSSNKGMLASVLLHLYQEEVRCKFCCLILQLIANRMNIQPLAGSQNIQCNYANTNVTVFKCYVHRTKLNSWEMIKVFIFLKVRLNYFTYSLHDWKHLRLI